MRENLLIDLAKKKQELRDRVAKKEFKDLLDIKLMVIDDCGDSLQLIEKYLAPFSEINPIFFTNEFEALKHFIDYTTDALIVDMKLNTINGHDVSRAINALSLFQVPTLFISSDAGEKTKIESLYDRTKIFQHKPLHRNELYAKLSEILRIGHHAKAA